MVSGIAIWFKGTLTINNGKEEVVVIADHSKEPLILVYPDSATADKSYEADMRDYMIQKAIDSGIAEDLYAAKLRVKVFHTKTALAKEEYIEEILLWK